MKRPQVRSIPRLKQVDAQSAGGPPGLFRNAGSVPDELRCSVPGALIVPALPTPGTQGKKEEHNADKRS